MTIRPWIKDRLDELDVECEIKNDNDSLFLIKHIDEVAADFTKDDVEDLIYNKNSKEFFEDYMQMNGHIGHVRVNDLLNHTHATTILWAMLDTLAIFEKFNCDWTQKIFKWIDPDVIYVILNGMPIEEARIIEIGMFYLYALYDEQGYSIDTTFDDVRTFIARAICDKKESVEYLKENPIFITDDVIAWNPRFNEFQYCHPTPSDICRNYGAIELLRELDRSQIDWINISVFHRDIEFMEANIQYLQLGKNSLIEESILMNDYMMPFIERHIDAFDKSLLYLLSSNASAIEYLEQHPELIDYGILSNPNIVTYDYDLIKKERFDIHRELHEYLYHPNRIQKWIDNGNEVEHYLQ